MPESVADDPFQRTEPRVRWLRQVHLHEFHCVALPTDDGLKWFPAGVGMSADRWLLDVRSLWTSTQSLHRAEVGRSYPMKLTGDGLARLRRWLAPKIDRRVS